MCTAVTYHAADFYFGRNLDLEYSYRETVTVTPRNYPFRFRKCGVLEHHYAMIGMAYVQDGYPLYYEATNEKGLSVGGLNFPGNAFYHEEAAGKDNISPFEFIPWVLGKCANLEEARRLLENINIVNINYSEELPLTPLHWIIADRSGAITVESVCDGLKVYDNPVGVLTNNPPFDYHMLNLSNYMQLSDEQPQNRFSKGLQLRPYSNGMGGLGLPGDLSSASRFIRAAFVKHHSVSGNSENSAVGQFFHILDSVVHARGSVKVGERYEITVYSSCCNVDKGIYYYKTYESHRIVGVDMNQENLDGCEIVCYPLLREERFFIQNEKNPNGPN